VVIAQAFLEMVEVKWQDISAIKIAQHCAGARRTILSQTTEWRLLVHYNDDQRFDAVAVPGRFRWCAAVIFWHK